MTHHGASRASPIPALARSPYSMTGLVEQWALTGGMGATGAGPRAGRMRLPMCCKWLLKHADSGIMKPVPG